MDGRAGRRLALDELVVYELHVGTFTPEGTFEAAIPRLPELAELGVTAIELMPVATFPGERGWGYDGVFTSAPHRAYGGPHGLARLVDAAHAAGLGVILDVVYNHVGPGSELVGAFGPYFTKRHQTFWGEALDYRQRGVREWAIQNAELWVRDYRDRRAPARRRRTRSSTTPSRTSWPSSRSACARRSPGALVISEMEVGNRAADRGVGPRRAVGRRASTTRCTSSSPASARATTGRTARSPTSPARSRTRPASGSSSARRTTTRSATARSATGSRPRRGGSRRRASSSPRRCRCSSWARSTARPRPFQFFTDHDDPAIAEATREGRRKEFKRFAAFAGEDVPDPQARETFERSRLDPAAGDAELRAFYAELIALRRGAAARGRDRRRREAARRSASAAATSSSSPTSST